MKILATPEAFGTECPDSSDAAKPYLCLRSTGSEKIKNNKEKSKSMEQDQSLLEEILRAIVTYPEKIEVSRHVDEMGVLLSVKLDQSDAGIVIGKDGRAIKAIRSVMNLVGRRSKARVSVRLDVPDMPRSERSLSSAL